MKTGFRAVSFPAVIMTGWAVIFTRKTPECTTCVGDYIIYFRIVENAYLLCTHVVGPLSASDQVQSLFLFLKLCFLYQLWQNLQD